jgi:hypothetical protein
VLENFPVISYRLSLRLCLLSLALLAACSSKPDHGATTLPRPTTTTSTTSAQRYAIPDPITPAYVNDVLAALNHVYGDVVRRQIAVNRLEPQDLVPLRAIYSEAEFKQQAAALAQSPSRPTEAYQAPIGDRRIIIEKLLRVGPACVSAVGTYDFSSILKQAPPPRPVWVSLRPKDAGTDAQHLNETPWLIASEDVTEVDRCA